MANKNTKNIRKLVRAAGKAGNDEITFSLPAGDYHNHRKPSMRSVTVPTARRNPQTGVVSNNERRNMQMVILQNANGQGGKGSLTAHTHIVPRVPVVFPNHEYMARDGSKRFAGYKQPSL